MSTKDVVLGYWNAWQDPADFAAMVGYLHSDASLDMGVFRAESASEWRAIVERDPTPWDDVALLASVFADDNAAIVYEGTHRVSGQRFRVAELITLRDGKIATVHGVLTEVPR
ncbi:MAG: nuclear transport factor 2 family protein [Myxococcota bacterium]